MRWCSRPAVGRQCRFPNRSSPKRSRWRSSRWAWLCNLIPVILVCDKSPSVCRLTHQASSPAPGLPGGTQARAAEAAAQPQNAVQRGFTDTRGQSCSAPAGAPLCNKLLRYVNSNHSLTSISFRLSLPQSTNC